MPTCKEEQRGRFWIIKLEERIAPSATVLNVSPTDDASVHAVLTPSGNLNAHSEATVDNGGGTSVEIDQEVHHKL